MIQTLMMWQYSFLDWALIFRPWLTKQWHKSVFSPAGPAWRNTVLMYLWLLQVNLWQKEKRQYFIGRKIFVQESHLSLRQKQLLFVWQILATDYQRQAVTNRNWAVDEWDSSMKPSLLSNNFSSVLKYKKKAIRLQLNWCKSTNTQRNYFFTSHMYLSSLLVQTLTEANLKKKV